VQRRSRWVRSVKKTVQWTVFSDARIGAVGRQEQEPAALGLEDFGGFGAFVGAEVAENDDGAKGDGRHELRRDVGVESVTVHGTFDDPRCDQLVCREACDEGLPSASWSNLRRIHAFIQSPAGALACRRRPFRARPRRRVMSVFTEVSSMTTSRCGASASFRPDRTSASTRRRRSSDHGAGMIHPSKQDESQTNAKGNPQIPRHGKLL
jgi:hypothetical protein